jgi:hypothetical protein
LSQLSKISRNVPQRKRKVVPILKVPALEFSNSHVISDDFEALNAVYTIKDQLISRNDLEIDKGRT